MSRPLNNGGTRIRWSPDGKELFYVEGAPDEQYEVVVDTTLGDGFLTYGEYIPP